MTKRLTFVGFALVAVVWGPYVYAELARKPLEADETAAEALTPVVVPTPVAYAPEGRLERSLSAATEPVAEPVHHAAPVDPPDDTPLAAAEPEPEVVEPPPSAAAAEPAAAAPATAAAHAPALPVEPVAAAAQPPAAVEPAVVQAEPENTAAEPAENHDGDGDKGDKPEAEKSAQEADTVRTTFDSESRDASWASHEEPRLAKLLSGAGLSSDAISEVRCQSTVCRVSINAAEVESSAQIQLYQRIREELGPALAIDPSAKEQHAAFYVLRKPE